MKCGYGNKCKFEGEVSKEEGVKVGNRYYHKKCLEEKELKLEIENFWNDNFPQCNIAVLRKAINTLIEKNNKPLYILFIMKWIKNNKKILNYPMGISNYCNNAELKKIWNAEKINEEYSKIKNELTNTKSEVVEFNYKVEKKKWTNLI